MVLLLILFLFICSFILFVASRHDFVLLRQNISIRLIFDRAFILVLFSLLMSRILYFIDMKMFDAFLNPLRFLHILLYWGLNFLGLFMVVALGVVFFFRKRKNTLRILDIYLLSFFPLLVFDATTHLLLGGIDWRIAVGEILVLLVVFIILIRMHTRFAIRDGVVAFGVLVSSAVFYLSNSLIQKGSVVLYSPVQIIALVVLAISIYCLALIKLDFFKGK